MHIRPSNSARRLSVAGVVLFVFCLRSLIPQGFMPSSEHPFSVEICPEGFPADLLGHAGHHHHGGGHASMDHCVFGTACASGPPSHQPTPALCASRLLAVATASTAGAIAVRLVYLPQSRGPPLPA